jgi:DNA primase
MTTQPTDLAEIISTAVAEKMTPEFVQEQVNARVDKLVRESIDNALRTYGENGKMIDQAVAAAMKVERLDLPSYGSMVAKMLEAKIEELVSPVLRERLAQDMNELLSLAPETVKLSKIVRDMVDYRRQDGEFGDVVTCIIEHTDYDGFRVYLDELSYYEDVEKHHCEIQIAISRDGKILSGRVGRHEIKAQNYFGRPYAFGGERYGLAAKIMSFYACGTIIEVDEDDVSTYADND